MELNDGSAHPDSPDAAWSAGSPFQGPGLLVQVAPFALVAVAAEASLRQQVLRQQVLRLCADVSPVPEITFTGPVDDALPGLAVLEES